MATQGTIIHPCSCINEFQDKTYGKGNRVHNVGIKEIFCTVCSPSNRRNKQVGESLANGGKNPFGQIVDTTARPSRRGKAFKIN